LADAERDVASHQTARHPSFAEPERSLNDEEPNFDFDW